MASEGLEICTNSKTKPKGIFLEAVLSLHYRCPKKSMPDKVYFLYLNLKARATILRCLFNPFSYSHNIRSCFSLEDDRVSLFPLDYFASSCFEWSYAWLTLIFRRLLVNFAKVQQQVSKSWELMYIKVKLQGPGGWGCSILPYSSLEHVVASLYKGRYCPLPVLI